MDLRWLYWEPETKLLERKKRIFEQADGNPFAEPVDIHSNVEGGYGVVAGRHTDTLRAEVSLE
jgi:hypothetical protein